MTTLFVDETIFMGEDAAALRALANCADCLARSASDREFQSLTYEEVASAQWIRCAQCRCGTHDWARR